MSVITFLSVFSVFFLVVSILLAFLLGKTENENIRLKRQLYYVKNRIPAMTNAEIDKVIQEIADDAITEFINEDMQNEPGKRSMCRNCYINKNYDTLITKMMDGKLW